MLNHKRNKPEVASLLAQTKYKPRSTLEVTLFKASSKGCLYHHAKGVIPKRAKKR